MSATPLRPATARRRRRPITEAAKCPLCGQSLTSAAHQRVEERQRRQEAQLRAKLRTEAIAEGRANAAADWASEKAMLTHEIDGLRRRVEGKSVQERGAERELDILALLRTAFPTDLIEPLDTDGDVLHTIRDRRHRVGQILYEVKNERRWLTAWVEKLKDDAATRGIDHVLLVTTRLPAKTEGFTVIDGVIVCDPKHSTRFAGLLRDWAIQAHRLGMDAPVDALFEYVAGEEFRGSIRRILKSTDDLDADLVNEQREHERRWGKRRKLQIGIGAAGAEIEQAVIDLIEDAGQAAPSAH